MKLVLVYVGKTRSDIIAHGVDLYASRIKRYMPFEIVAVPDVKTSRSLTEARQKEIEGEAILSRIDSKDFVVLLDERGVELTSRQFAGFIDKKSVQLPAGLVFVIGGPYGFSDRVYERADYKLSLSKMTFNHEMVRLFFTEQIYRAMTILRGEPYHHD